MLRRAALAASFTGAILAHAHGAQASGAWLTSESLTPVEQRVAVAVGPARTTLWTSLRFTAAGGPMAIVVPAPPGSSLDTSSDAWFEALEVATAPRVFPPPNVSPFCPGASGPPSIFETDGQTTHTQSLAPEDVTVLTDAPSVVAWAEQENLHVSSVLIDELAAYPSGTSFLAVLFAAPAGPSVTPTLRIAMPGAPATLPLALTRAGGSDLRVTTWIIGQGQASLGGATRVMIPPKSLVWHAGAEGSNYADLRAAALAPGPEAFLVEAANHEALADNVAIGNGSSFIDGVVTTFFERAAAYGDGAFDSSACIATATPEMASSSTVAASCPRAALGVIEPAAACTEAPAAGQIDPQTLRCGAGADDLAVALSGLDPAATWVTRQSLLIPTDSGGTDSSLAFATGPEVSPTLDATSVDTSDCGDAGTSSSSSTSTSTSSGSSVGSGSGSSSGGESTGSGGPIGGGAIDVEFDLPDDVDTGCSCSGTEAASGDSVESGSGDSCDSGSDPSSSGCSGSSDDSSSSSGCSGDNSGSSGCSGGDSGGDSCSGGGGGGDCGGGGGGSFNCAVFGAHGLRGPKFSVMLMAALAVAAPLRRRGRRRRGSPRSTPRA
jgi:Uncharacterized protein conserved in bacteria (DUF2330)